MSVQYMFPDPTFTVVHAEASLSDGLTVTLRTTQRPTPEYIAAMLSTSEVRVFVPTTNRPADDVDGGDTVGEGER